MNIKVLIVEAEPAHADILCHHLQKNGHTNLRVESTLEACREAVDSFLPDIILTSLHLPDGDALELLHDIDGRIPVITMTSCGSEKHTVDILKAGAVDYLTKSADTFAAIPLTVEQAWREWQLRKDKQTIRGCPR